MKEVMTTADVAKVFGVVPATVRLWERLGKLPAQRTSSGMRLFLTVDVMRLATERAIQAPIPAVESTDMKEGR